jgi:hypothetical protein
MSKRTSFSRRPSLSLALVRTFICAALLLLPTVVRAQTAPYIGFGGFAGYPGQFVTHWIELSHWTSPIAIGGFDFLIGYDSQILSLTEALPGSTINDCGWEYFTYRSSVNSDCTDSCPSSLLRLVGIADMNNGNVHPSCYTLGDGARLAYITFHVAPNASYTSRTQLSFYWKDCGDNVLSSVAGDSIYLAKLVYGYDYLYDTLPLPTPSTLPSWNGTPESCVSMPGKTAVRYVNYHDGSVWIYPPLANRGDLNLNGISYEIADLVMFLNYFLYGMSVFDPINWRQQAAQSDVNADGIELTLRDAVFMQRIIMGDVQPNPKGDTELLNATFVQDTTAKEVTVNCRRNLAGVLLRFQGLVEPTLHWPIWTWTWGQDTLQNTTTVIVLSPDKDSCGCGTVITYTGEGTLVYADAADWFDSEVKTNIVTTGVTPTYGDVNGSGSINVADVIYLVVYIFQGGAYPIDPYHGDMDCDGSCNIGDAIYLLNYIFAGGPAPCGNR